MHDLPKRPERVLPNFDPRKDIYAEDHLKSFYLARDILNVEHKDVECRLFPYNFDHKASSWFFGLQANSIANWDTFERVFKRKFGNQKTVATLMKELLSMRMEKKEKDQDLNQRFTTLLSSFSATTKPIEESLVEYHTTTLYPPIAMFVKRVVKATLVENYEEAKKVEADLDSITRHTL